MGAFFVLVPVLHLADRAGGADRLAAQVPGFGPRGKIENGCCVEQGAGADRFWPGQHVANSPAWLNVSVRYTGMDTLLELNTVMLFPKSV